MRQDDIENEDDDDDHQGSQEKMQNLFPLFFVSLSFFTVQGDFFFS